MFSNIVCPISDKRVDSNVSRLTVFISALVMIAFMITRQPLLLYLLAIDCGIRAFGYNSYSPMCILASSIAKVMGWKPKMVDKAPKMFASRLGFICALLGSIFITLHMVTAAMVIIGLFLALALMDSVLNFCVGCLIYHHLVFPFYEKRII